MMRSRAQIFFSYLLLVYFIGFVVPPISALLPSAYPLDLSEGRLVQKKNCNQQDMMLIDLFLWEILNRTKRSDEQLEKFATIEKNASLIPGCEGYAVRGDIVEAPVTVISREQSQNIFFYACNQHFTHSGLSPPQAV